LLKLNVVSEQLYRGAYRLIAELSANRERADDRNSHITFKYGNSAQVCGEFFMKIRQIQTLIGTTSFGTAADSVTAPG